MTNPTPKHAKVTLRRAQMPTEVDKILATHDGPSVYVAITITVASNAIISITDAVDALPPDINAVARMSTADAATIARDPFQWLDGFTTARGFRRVTLAHVEVQL